MTDAKKFLFDTHDFSQVQSKVDMKIYTEEEMQMAQNQSFALGEIGGLKKAKQQQEEQIAGLLQKTLLLMEKLAQAEDRREVEKCVAAAKLTMQVTRKLLPQFSLHNALREIEHVVSRALEDKEDEPRIAVTVPAAHLDALKARIDAVAAEKFYAGKIILLADDTLPPTDCRVEWADGGAERLYERLFSQIEDKFAKAVSTMEANLA
jgi:flagellar assembly protein FliH